MLGIDKERSDEIYNQLMGMMRKGNSPWKLIPSISATKEEAAYLAYALKELWSNADEEKVYHRNEE